jgi:hypothetical protein
MGRLGNELPLEEKIMNKVATIIVCLGLLGCKSAGQEYDEYLEQSDQKYKADMDRIQAKYAKNMKDLEEKEAFCRRGLNAVPIGWSEEDTITLLKGVCPPALVNTTTTAHMVHEQWVFHGVEPPGFLYFDNGKLVGKQL